MHDPAPLLPRARDAGRPVTVVLATSSSSSGIRAHAIYLIAAIPLLIAVVVSIVVWRNARAERAAGTLRAGLSSPDPAVRRAALDALGPEAIGPNAAVLCGLLERERDPDVLDALAAAVARSRWEPTDDASLLELRRFVAGGTARATRSSARPGAISGEGTGGPASAPGSTATVTLERGPTDGGARVGDGDLAELVPKVNALLDGRLERLELVSFDGEVLTRWSADAPADGDGDQSPK